jgi:hypothetical protein
MEIIAVAIRHNELIYTLPQPNRHHNLIHHMVQNLLIEAPVKGEQGFLTSAGEFVDRVQAAKMLDLPGQLYSEDLW